MNPTPRLPLSLVVLALLLSGPALAQLGVCKDGVKCASRDFTSTVKGGTAVCAMGPNASWAWDTGTSVSTFGWYAAGTRCTGGQTPLISMSVNETVVAANASGGWRAGTQGFQAADGSTATASFNWSSDANTGFYRPASDTFSAVCGGGVVSTWRTIGQQLINGSGAQPSLHFTSNSTTGLYYGSTGGVGMAQAGATIAEWQLAAPLSFQGAAKSFATDSFTGRAYYQPTSSRSDTPPVDLGGAPHGVLQRHYWELTAGMESAVQHQWYPRAPFIGAAAVGLPTYVDSAGATTVQLGSTPYVFDARGSVTTAVANNISSMIAPLIVRTASRAPRWCQKLALSSGTTIRAWAGIAGTLPGSTDSPANSNLSFRYSTNAGDSKWQYCYGNGVSTTCADTGVAPNLSGFETLCIDCREGGTTACTWWVNGAAVGRVTSGLAAGYPLGPFYSIETLAASARTLWAGSISIEVN